MENIYDTIRDNYFNYIEKNKTKNNQCILTKNELNQWIYDYINYIDNNICTKIIAKYGLGRFLSDLPNIAKIHCYQNYDDMLYDTYDDTNAMDNGESLIQMIIYYVIQNDIINKKQDMNDKNVIIFATTNTDYNIYDIIRNDYNTHKSYFKLDQFEWMIWLRNYIFVMNYNDKINLIAKYGIGRMLIDLGKVKTFNCFKEYDTYDDMVKDIYTELNDEEKGDILVEEVLIFMIKNDIIPELITITDSI